MLYALKSKKETVEGVYSLVHLNLNDYNWIQQWYDMILIGPFALLNEKVIDSIFLILITSKLRIFLLKEKWTNRIGRWNSRKQQVMLEVKLAETRKAIPVCITA